MSRGSPCAGLQVSHHGSDSSAGVSVVADQCARILECPLHIRMHARSSETRADATMGSEWTDLDTTKTINVGDIGAKF